MIDFAARLTVRLLLVSSLVTPAGCGGEKRVVVRGRVSDNQAPLIVSPQGQIWIVFTPAGVSGDTYAISHSASVDRTTGRYELVGNGGKGIPPGQYHVVVRQLDPYPVRDRLKGVFRSPSQVIRDVTAGTEVDIDVATWRSTRPERQ